MERSTDDADLAAIEQVTVEIVRALDGIDESQWHLATPCTDWKLVDLVDHVVGGNWFTVRVFAGDTADEAMAATMARFADGSASGSVARRSALDQLEAFTRAGYLERSWDHVAGQLSGRQMLRLRVHDLIVHTWDIEETCRPPASVSAELARWGLRELQDDQSLMARHFEIPEVTGTKPSATDVSSAYLWAFGR